MNPERDLHRLVPHRGPMLLLDEVVDASPAHLVAKHRVREGVWPTEGMPAYVTIEILAQAIAAFESSRSPRGDGKPAIGVLLGTRAFRSRRPAFAAGTTLILRVDEQMSDPSGFGAFQGSVQDEAGETLAEGMLKVYRPEDFWAYLAQSNPR